MIRFSRNLDMLRGFVDGALGQAVDVYCSRRDHVVFTLLLTSGIMLLVHPICVGGRIFLPCSYGYAVTVRKAQGASRDGVVCNFELAKPLERGFAYVALSRARRHLISLQLQLELSISGLIIVVYYYGIHCIGSL